MTSFIEIRSKKIRAALEKATSFPRASCLENDLTNRYRALSHWELLPVELQISIFCRCRLQDIQCLRLVSHSIRDSIDVNEHAIARDYLRLRRHGSLPQPTFDTLDHTRAPEDDVILLSDLFPPSKPRDSSSPKCTFKYLASLQRRQQTCSKLSSHLADRVMLNYIKSNPNIKASFVSKLDRQICHNRGVEILQFQLTPIMFYVLRFLESYDEAVREDLDRLSRQPGIIPNNRPWVPYSPPNAQSIQYNILKSPPFNNPDVLISTHHVFVLLSVYLLDAVTPDFPRSTSGESLASMLLSVGLHRIVEFFDAEKGGGPNQHALRRGFMRNMRQDWDIYTERFSSVYGADRWDGQPNALEYIWRRAADQVLREIGCSAHQSRDCVEVWEGAKICFCCRDCDMMADGWVSNRDVI